MEQPTVDGVRRLGGSDVELVAVAEQESSTATEAQHHVAVADTLCISSVWYIACVHLSSNSRWWAMSVSWIFLTDKAEAIRRSYVEVGCNTYITGASTFVWQTEEYWSPVSSATDLRHCTGVGLSLARLFSHPDPRCSCAHAYHAQNAECVRKCRIVSLWC